MPQSTTQLGEQGDDDVAKKWGQKDEGKGFLRMTSPRALRLNGVNITEAGRIKPHDEYTNTN